MSALGNKLDAAILVVDDIDDNRFALTRRLAREGYKNVATANDGRQALELLNSKQFDLVLLDIMMPNMNGYEVLERMKADDKLRHIPVVMISAIDELDSVVRCIELGAEDYLPKPFNPTLLRARVGAALDRKRLHDEVAESLAQQTATADVLKVISRSTFELQIVLDTLVESATRLCEADSAVIFRPEGVNYRHAASHGLSSEFKRHTEQVVLRPDGKSVVGRALATRTTVHVPDVALDSEYAQLDPQIFGGHRAFLGVPLLREGSPIGVIMVGKRAAGDYTEQQIALVTTFADQAVIAIENVRLFDAEQARTRELAESLQQQTATSEVLQVISSSPGDLTPVFNSILANARRICEAKFAHLLLYDGQMFHAAAMEGASPAFVEFWQRGPHALDPETGPRRAVATKQVVHVPDVQQTARYQKANPQLAALADLAGARAVLVVPMVKDDRVIGTLSIYRGVPVAFSDKQIELVSNFARQAVIAIENTRLLSELRESLQQQTATADVLKVISRSTFDLQTVLDTLIESAVRLCEADLGGITRQKDEAYRQVASYGYPAELAEFMRNRPLEVSRGTITGRTALERKVVQIPDILADPEYKFVQASAIGSYRTMLGVPLLREGEPIGVIVLMRRAVRPFTDKQIELVTTFADQAVIAIENVRLFDAEQARTRELRESLQQQTATSEVLQVISSSPGELEPVFDAMLTNAIRICEAQFGNFLSYENGGFRHVKLHGAPPAYAEAMRLDPVLYPKPGHNLDRLAKTKRLVHVSDVTAQPPATQGQLGKLAGARTLLIVPMLKDDALIGAIGIYRQEVRPFSDKQIALVTNFAAQAVIAIENTRLLNELRQRTDDLTESLEQQTATSEVLKVISSSPGDLDPVFQSVLENAVHLCGAKFGALCVRDGDAFRAVAMHGTPTFTEERQRDPLIRVTPGHNLDIAVRTKAVVHLPNLSLEQAGPALFNLAGARALLNAPLLKDSEVIGSIAIYRTEPGPFADKQIGLLQNFAAQAVIAIENTRLLNELRQRTDDLTESLEQQTATSEVLSVISSSPGDLAPVFEAILANATRICEARFGNLSLYDGETYRNVAIHDPPGEYAARGGHDVIRPHPESLLGCVSRTKQIAQIDDIRTGRPYLEGDPAVVALADLAGARTVLVVPMLKESRLVGTIAIYRQEVRPFTDKQIELVTSFAHQAVIAIENVRLLNELRARTSDLAQSVEELRALGDVSQAVSSTLDLETVLSTIVAKAAQLSGTEAGAIYVFDEAEREFELRATYGMTDDMSAALVEHHVDVSDALRAVTQRRQPDQVADLRNEPSSRANELVMRLGFRARLIVPLVHSDEVVGALVVRRKAPGEFSKSTIDLLQTFGAQSVLAIQNARLFTEIGEKSHQLELASQHKSQFLANMSHELRTPLNAILGYTELVLDDIYGEVPGKMRGVLERVQRNGKHLLGLINDVLDLSKIEAGQLTLSLADYSIGEMVQTVIVAVEPLATAKNLALRSELPPNLPRAHGDERRIAQVLLNLVGNAIKFTDTGEVAVRASTANGSFTIAVRDTGPGVPEADQAKIFEEFLQADTSATKKKGGTGLGLSISKRIIKMHGGNIGVESRLGQGSTFSITLPLIVEKQAANE